MKVLLKMVCVNHRNANYFYYHKGQAKDARGRIQLLGWNFGLWVFPNAGEHLEQSATFTLLPFQMSSCRSLGKSLRLSLCASNFVSIKWD